MPEYTVPLYIKVEAENYEEAENKAKELEEPRLKVITTFYEFQTVVIDMIRTGR